MAPAIPDRWTDYKPIGEKIEGTRFIAFKVPLKEHISNNVDSPIRLDNNILLKMIPNLGLIIDLTNTHRYYDPKIFQKEGIEHIKLMVPGHKTPPKRLADQFNMIVKDFMESNEDNDKLIGVHCTHGVNRTGYLICNYMISQMTIEPNVAIDRFSNARGHKIERDNYIDALNKLLETNIKDSVEPDNWRDRNAQNVYPDMHRDQQNWRNRSPQLDRNSYNNYRERSRSRSRSPPPYYSRYNERNDYYTNRRPTDQYAERPYYPPTTYAAQGVREFGSRNANSSQSNQPSRLRLNYYNGRTTDRS